MATTVLKDAYIGVMSYKDSGGTHNASWRCGGLYYDDVIRSGNTVTLTNAKIKSYVQFVRTNHTWFGFSKVWYSWIGIWDSSSTTYAGTAPIAKTSQFQISTAGSKYYDSPHTVKSGDINIGNISFTVSGNNAGTKTLKLGLATSLQNSNANSASTRDNTDPAPTFTISYPANTVNLTIQTTRLDVLTDTDFSRFCTVDVSINGTKTDNDVTSYSKSISTGATYLINDITETSSSYYYTGASSFSGTLSSNTTINLPFSLTSYPTNTNATLVSRTHNSIVVSATVDSYGAPSSRYGRYVEVGLLKPSSTSYISVPLKQLSSNTISTGNATFDQTNDTDEFTIAGAMSFKIGAKSSNTKLTDSIVVPDVYWLPPAPLEYVKLVGTSGDDDNATFSLDIKGSPDDNVSNISGAKVDTQFRYSIDNGASYTEWSNVSTNRTPSDVITAIVTVPYNTDVMLEARQVTTGDTSQSSIVSKLTIKGVSPKPISPTIKYSYDDLNREMTIIISGNGSEPYFQGRRIKLAYGYSQSDIFIDEVLTEIPSIYKVSYLKPNNNLVIYATTVNTGGVESPLSVIETVVRRPIWGVVAKNNHDGEDEKLLIRDMTKVSNGLMSPRDWIEGENLGEKRIVKN